MLCGEVGQERPAGPWEPLLRLVLSALEGVRLGWGGERQSRAELRGRYTVSTQDGAKGGEWQQESSCSGHGSQKPSRKAHFPGAGSRTEGGRKLSGKGCLEEECLCERQRDWGVGMAGGDPWGGALQSQEGAGVWRSREDKH